MNKTLSRISALEGIFQLVIVDGAAYISPQLTNRKCMTAYHRDMARPIPPLSGSFAKFVHPFRSFRSGSDNSEATLEFFS